MMHRYLPLALAIASAIATLTAPLSISVVASAVAPAAEPAQTAEGLTPRAPTIIPPHPQNPPAAPVALASASLTPVTSPAPAVAPPPPAPAEVTPQPTPKTKTKAAPETATPTTPMPKATPAAAKANQTPAPAGYAPNRLVIPALGVNAPLFMNGIAGGQMVLPTNPALLTLFTGGVMPCGDTQGAVVIAGHVEYNGKAGALNHLSNLAVGSEAVVTCSDGTPTKWVAVSKTQTTKTSGGWQGGMPLGAGDRRLIVVTCAGAVVNGVHVDNVAIAFRPE